MKTDKHPRRQGHRWGFKGTLPMTVLCSGVLLIGCLPSSGQTDSVFDLQGVVELVDRPPEATPVEAVSFRLHPLEGGFEIEAQPDRDGKFILKGVRPGRYSLTYPMPGRIETFANGPNELAPEGFELKAGSQGPLRLVISMKSSNVAVEVRGVPAGHRDVVVILAPADPHLTLRESCSYNQLGESEGGEAETARPLKTDFRFVPLGKYRILVIDAEFKSAVAAYAPRFPDFLKNEGASVEVSATGQSQATATYVDGETVQEAIRQACPEILRVWPGGLGAPLKPSCRGQQPDHNQ